MAGSGFEPKNDEIKGIKKSPNMAQNTKKTHNKHCFYGFFHPIYPIKSTWQRSFQRVDLANNVLYSRGAPLRRAPAVAYMEYY